MSDTYTKTIGGKSSPILFTKIPFFFESAKKKMQNLLRIKREGDYAISESLLWSPNGVKIKLTSIHRDGNEFCVYSLTARKCTQLPTTPQP